MNTFLWLGGAAAFMLATWLSFWLYQSRNFGKSGYVALETSWGARFVFAAVSRLVAFLTVGPVTVIGAENVPRHGRMVAVGNHQVKSDFACAWLACRRYFVSLGAAAQFPGPAKLLAAWLGVIPVTYGSKEERAQAERSCVDYVAGKGSLALPFWFVLLSSLTLLSGIVVAALSGATVWALALFFALCGVLSFPGGDRMLLVAPQGALMPDNVLKKEEFRAGAVRVSRCAARQLDRCVPMLPMGVLYKRDPKDAHWSHRFLKKTRSMFLGLRNPVYWNPLFKLDLSKLSAGERAEVERQKAEALYAYEHSHITSYGAVVVVGKPIDPATLPEDPVEAIEVIRLKIADLLELAAKV